MISKHLMLQFINSCSMGIYASILFKNISCYSLSLVFMPFFLSYLIFSLILSHFHFFTRCFSLLLLYLNIS